MHFTYDVQFEDEDEDGTCYLFFEIQGYDSYQPFYSHDRVMDDKIEIVHWGIDNGVRVTISSVPRGFYVRTDSRDSAMRLKLQF